jgi:hypothetical protein
MNVYTVHKSEMVSSEAAIQVLVLHNELEAPSPGSQLWPTLRAESDEEIG